MVAPIELVAERTGRSREALEEELTPTFLNFLIEHARRLEIRMCGSDAEPLAITPAARIQFRRVAKEVILGNQLRGIERPRAMSHLIIAHLYEIFEGRLPWRARPAGAQRVVLVLDHVEPSINVLRRMALAGADASDLTRRLLAFGEPLPGDEPALRAALVALGGAPPVRALTQADVWKAFEDAGWGWVLERLDDAAGGEQGKEIADRLNEMLGFKPGPEERALTVSLGDFARGERERQLAEDGRLNGRTREE